MLVREKVKAIVGEFPVTFNGRGLCGSVYGVYQGHKILPSTHSQDAHAGETWLVEELTHWNAGCEREPSNLKKDHVQWGGAIYVRLLRRLD